MKREELEREIVRYTTLDGTLKKEIDKEIESVWSDMSADYYNLCIEDEELNKLKDELDRIHGIISFDIEDEYTKYAYTANEGLYPEDEEDVYVFDKKQYKEAQEISKNIEIVKQDILKKLEKLRGRKYAFLKDSRIQKLEKELTYKQEIAKNYDLNMKKKQEREYYLANEEKLITPLKERYNEILTNYASKVIHKHLESNPSIIVKEHNSIISTSEEVKSFNKDILNKVFNNIRKELYKDISKKNSNNRNK